MGHDHHLSPNISQEDSSYTSRTPWMPLLNEQLLSQAQETVHWIAKRMRDLEYVQQISQCPPPWRPWAAAELALFYHYMACCFPEQDWHIPTQQYLKLIEVNSQQNGLVSPALFGGTSGIAFVIQQCSEQGQRYQRTLAHLHHVIAEQVYKRACWQRPLETHNTEHNFDVITGASGITSYLTSVPSSDSIVHETLRTLLDYLLMLTEPGQTAGQEKWFSPPSLLLTERDRQLYPHGRFNCGLAHGIAGPLAALALTALAGYDYPGLRESIASVSTWLIQHQFHDEWSTTWPKAIPYELACSPAQWCTLPGARATWCYGAPGIARSLWLAGRALNDGHLTEVALDALKAILRRPFSARKINSPILCHGDAGLLLICLRFAHESHDPFLLEQIPFLVEHILAQFDLQSPLGFRDIEPTGIQVDRPGFLTGASGIALALLAAASPVAPSWDRLLLLS